MRIYAIFGILIILSGAVMHLERRAVAAAENEALRKESREFRRSAEGVADASRKEAAAHEAAFAASRKTVIELSAEAERLRSQIADSDGQLCRPGCIVQ